jgi:hypothetical protein
MPLATPTPLPGYPMAPAPGLPAEPVLVSIGDISVTQSTVYTPSGSRPLNEVSWTVADMSMTSQGIPSWAIVCAIIFTILFCGLGLLFLLAKEYKTTGAMQVTVSGPGFVYTSSIPVYSPVQVADINARVNYARTVAAAAIPQAPFGGVNDQPPATWQQPGQAW